MTDNISGIMSSDIGVNRGFMMTDKSIDLDPSELLGLSHVAKVSTAATGPEARLPSKISETPPTFPTARLLSKIGVGGEANGGGNGG